MGSNDYLPEKALDTYTINMCGESAYNVHCLLTEYSLCHFFVRDKEMAERKRVRRFPPADPHLRRTPPFGT
jgi:hypothetical protein